MYVGSSYACTITISNSQLDLWSWFPVGRAGVRMFFLFFGAFLVFILRVAQLHVGMRTTNSPASTFVEYAATWTTVQTSIWYISSALLFSEIYHWCAPKNANINWFTDGKVNERPRLNERHLYLNTCFFALALVQTGLHLCFDYDRVHLPVHKTSKDNVERKPEDGSVAAVSPAQEIQMKAFPTLFSCIKRSLIMTAVTPVIYYLFVRRALWSYTLGFVKMFRNLPKSTALPVVTPFHWQMFLRTIWAGTLLIFMWEVANHAFSTYVAQAPLKNDRPITFESKDPNGSLITGLNGQKLQTRAFAFWELVLISERFQGRRKAIYEDIDRKGGSAWTQILAASRKIIEEMNLRVAKRDPVASPAEKIETTAKPQLVSMLKQEGPNAPVEPIQTLPRLTRDIPKENVWTNPSPPKTMTDKLGRVTHDLADKYGHAQGPEAKKLLIKAKDAIITPEREQMMTPIGIWSYLNGSGYVTQFLKSPYGTPFRQTFRRRIAAVVLGKPHGDVGIIVDAADALSRFAVCSLKEDSFGNVQKDVPGIITLLTNTIVCLEDLRTTFGMHWTDVSGEKSCEELDEVLTAYRSALKDVFEAFESYFDDMRVGSGDVRRAREAMATKEVNLEKEQEMQEMQETRKGR